MKKKIAIIFSILIFSVLSFSAAAADTVYELDAHRFNRPYCITLDSSGNEYVEPTYYEYTYSPAEANVICGPEGTPIVIATPQGDGSTGNRIYRLSAGLSSVFGTNNTYVYMQLQGRIYVNSTACPRIAFRYQDHSTVNNYVNRYVYIESNDPRWRKVDVSSGQDYWYCDFNFFVTDDFMLTFSGMFIYDTNSFFVAYGFEDFTCTFGLNPYGAQEETNSKLTETNSMMTQVTSVITGSVNTAPLTSGVNNIVGNVTSMIPETTDIPYVSDALGSLTQLTNVAAAEIGNFFDPFFTADMSVTVAGVTFNPFITFLIISVVIALITFAIKIFTRGDHER